MKAFIFPGQGSQHVGMGKGLFEQFPDTVRAADRILGYSLEELCLEDPKKQLAKTNFTQPALYAINALSYRKLIEEGALQPAYFAGHSLGEYNALHAAGVFDFEVGLRLVQRRGKLMSEASEGAMAAVLACDEEKIRGILQDNNISTLDIANLNSPDQIVIAGPRKDIIAASPLFDAIKVRYIPLNVSAPFHSRYMQPVVSEFTRYLSEFDFRSPVVPVISNVYARPYQNHQMKDNLALQIKSPVNWIDSIRFLMGQGVDEYEEVGPGKVLTKLVHVIQAKTTPLHVESSKTEVELAVIEPVNVTQAGKVKTPKLASLGREASAQSGSAITPITLGSEAFKQAYNTRLAYIAGGMANAVASKDLVVKMAKARLLSFFGTEGLSLADIASSIEFIQENIDANQPYGMNLLCSLTVPEREMKMVDLFIKYGVKHVEASSYPQLTPAIVKYRLTGVSLDSTGRPKAKNNIIAKVSRSEVAEAFLSPAPEWIVNALLQQGLITKQEAEYARLIPVADDICVQSDCGGSTNMAVVTTLFPAVMHLRDVLCNKYNYPELVRVGAGGGIGTPFAAASVFMLGADFILTGSINQCTVESGASHLVKDMLHDIDVQHTAYAPASDMFELGSKVQVLSRGVFFPSRANKLYELWKHYDSFDAIDSKTRKQIEEKYFKCSFDDAFVKARDTYINTAPELIRKAESNPKQMMSMVFKWYLHHSMHAAISGDAADKVNYQVYCGPALGAFNQWVKGTDIESWRNRYVDKIADKLMSSTAEFLNYRIKML